MSIPHEFSQHMQEWCTKHKATLYISHDDQLTDEQITAIIKAAQLPTAPARFDALCAVSCDLQENCIDWQWEVEKTMYDKCVAAFEGDDPTDEDGEAFDAFQCEYLQWEGSLLDDLARNTPAPHIVAYPYTDDAPDGLDADATAIALGAEREAMAPTYESETLAVCGTLDMQEVIQRIWDGQCLQGITITPEDAPHLLLHCGWNGSGNMGEIKPTKTVTLPALFVHDNPRRHGVDAVYGFTGQFWQYDLNAVWEG